MFICFYYKAQLLFYVCGQDLDMISMAFRKMDLMEFVRVLIRNCFLHVLFSEKEQTYLCFHWLGRNKTFAYTAKSSYPLNTRSGHRGVLPAPCPSRINRIKLRGRLLLLGQVLATIIYHRNGEMSMEAVYWDDLIVEDLLMPLCTDRCQGEPCV